MVWVKFVLRGTCVLALLGASATLRAQSPVDPALIQALQQATQDIHEQNTDLDSLVWLSTMSEKIVERIPDPFYRIRLLKAVHAEAEATGLDPQLVLAVIDIESNFDRHALSNAGAQGLMQVMPFWKEVIGQFDDNLYNPLVNLRYGCRILRHYMDKYPDPVDALAAYNGSLGRTTYPNKVFGRLSRQWEYKEDPYSRTFRAPKLAIEEHQLTPIN